MSAIETTHKIEWERQPYPTTIGLALGGGAARGIAHIGVLQVLEAYGIRPSCIAGTSIGSLVGGMYAAGISPTRMEVLAENMRWRSLASVNIPSISLANLSLAGGNIPFLEGATGLFDLHKIVGWIDSVLGGAVTFADLQLPFAAMATDLVNGTSVALNEGPISTAIHASCAVPMVFTPVHRGDRMLVDGGVSQNLPAAAVRVMGADYVIAVDLLPTGGATVVSRPQEVAYQPRHIVDVTMHSLYALIRVTQTDIYPPDTVITPAIGHLSFTNLGANAELIAAGRTAAEAAMPGILKDLGRV
jgi:NTE family protein